MLPRAITSDEHTRIQINGQWSEVLAAIPTPAILYTARVNGTPASLDQLPQITYDGGSGTLADVIPGMTIWVGSSAGAWDKGQARIRKTPSSTIFYIGTESEIDVADNDYLTVVDEFGLWQKRVKISGGVIYLDEDVTYVDQNDARLPVVVMGGTAILELSGATLTVAFDASNSWVPGGGSKTYSWAAPGSVSIDDATAAAPVITYNAAGRYRVSCTVTIGGVSSTRYEYVQVYDTAHPPMTQFAVRSISGSKSEGGYSFQMTAYAQAGLADIRDRAQVILFTRDHFGTQGRVPVGYASGRENILCVGWIAGETIQWSPELGYVTFQVEGAHSWLGRVTAYPQGLEDVTTTPALWTDYNGLTMTAFLWHLLVWRSTAAQALDCIVEISTTRTIELAAAATSLWEQLQVTAGQRLLAVPCTDHLGRLFVLIDSQYRADRTGVVEVMTLAKADWRAPIVINRNPVSNAAMVDMNGFAWDGTNATALFSLSPGRIWKRYGRVLSHQALLLDDQDQANTLCGLIAGQANNDYPSIQIQLAGNNRFLDIAPDCYALLTVAAADTPRGIAFTDKRIIPRRISWSWDAASGGLLPTADFEAESFGEISITGDAPATEPVPPPNVCPPGQHWNGSECVDDNPPPPPPGVGDGNTVFVATYNRLGRTRNFLSGSPTWVDITTPSLSGTIRDFCLYSSDPANTGFVATSDTIYAVTNLLSDTPTWTVILSYADIDIGSDTGPGIFQVLGSPINNAAILWVGWSSAHRCGATVIYGIAAVPSGIFTGIEHYEAPGLGNAFPLGVSLVGSVRRIVADFTYDHIARIALREDIIYTLDWDAVGLTVTPSTLFAGGGKLLGYDVSYPDAAVSQYFTLAEGSSVWIYKSNDSGNNFAISLTLATGSSGVDSLFTNYYSVNVATGNEDDAMVALRASSDAHPGIYRTLNGGGAWSLLYRLPSGTTGPVTALGRWPYDPERVYFLNDSIYYSADGLATDPQNKIGNWAAVCGTWSPPSADSGSGAGPVMIIPVWVAA